VAMVVIVGVFICCEIFIRDHQREDGQDRMAQRPATTTFKQINTSWLEPLTYPYDNIQGVSFYHFSSGFFLNSS
jgi:hypothetical protein